MTDGSDQQDRASSGRFREVITVEGVSKDFRGTMALDSVSFAFSSGTTALLGRNGAGKTTLINLIGGVVLPSDGSISTEGHPACSSEAVELIARQMELPGTAGFLTAKRLERLLGLTSEEKEGFASLRHRFGVPDRPMGKLSKGNQLKLALALAFARARPILLLDEPTSGLDIFGVEVLAELIADRRASGMTTLVATHQPTLTPDLFDHAVVIDEGRLLYIGDLPGLLDLAPEPPGQATPTARLAGAMLRLITGDR
jgi:ABC-type multidrug transport system ATPase subunit